MDCNKEKKGPYYDKNRTIQKEMEKHLEVVPEIRLVCLGDLNGRLNKLEPNIDTDENGKMIEEWIQEQGLHHLNQSSRCTGVYTYGRPNGPRSAVDHILVNSLMEEGFRGMSIDENVEKNIH